MAATTSSSLRSFDLGADVRATQRALASSISGLCVSEDPEKLYTLEEHIGTGSYGQVFRGRSVENGMAVAIKVIRLEPGEEMDEVLNEINFLRGCNDRNIVSYIGSFLRKGGYIKGQRDVWIVMEYCGGGSIEAAYKGGHCKRPLLKPSLTCNSSSRRASDGARNLGRDTRDATRPRVLAPNAQNAPRHQVRQHPSNRCRRCQARFVYRKSTIS